MNISVESIDSVRDFGELNHLLFVLEDLSQDEALVTKSRASQAFEGQCFRGYVVGMADVLEVALMFRLLDIDSNRIMLTSLGKSFLKKNESRSYEVTPEQRDMLVTSLLFSMSPLSRMFDLLMRDLSFEKEFQSYEAKPMADNAGSNSRRMRFIGFSLGFLVRENRRVFVNRDFNPMIAKKMRILRNSEWLDEEPSEEDLEISRHAEHLVADNEIARLSRLSRSDLAEGVEIVSEYDSTSGFDIMSYKGSESTRSIPDRFIEVKSSTSNELMFALTRNEMNRARELEESYAIVFLGNHSLDKEIDECYVEEIPNPAKTLFDTRFFHLDSKKYVVTRAKPEESR